MLEVFRKVALVEGITTLALFLVAMPLKYLADYPDLVPPVGWLHGIAFITYIVVMAIAFARHRIGVVGWLRSFVAALFPFGTFINDPWVARQAARLEPARG
jgi:integral membrane protein